MLIIATDASRTEPVSKVREQNSNIHKTSYLIKCLIGYLSLANLFTYQVCVHYKV